MALITLLLPCTLAALRLTRGSLTSFTWHLHSWQLGEDVRCCCQRLAFVTTIYWSPLAFTHCSPTMNSCFFHCANAFPKQEGLMLSVLNGAFDAVSFRGRFSRQITPTHKYELPASSFLTGHGCVSRHGLNERSRSAAEHNHDRLFVRPNACVLASFSSTVASAHLRRG